MADRNQLKLRHEIEIDEADPLAELTRIMGFDPRKEPAAVLDDDLGIDLERELMGEFGSANDDRPAHASDPEPELNAPAPAAEDAEHPSAAGSDALGDFDATFDEMFAAAPVPEPQLSMPAAAPEGQSFPEHAGAESSADEADLFDAEFDEAVAASLEDSWEPADDFEEIGPVAEASQFDDGEVDLDFTGQLSPAEHDLSSADSAFAFDAQSSASAPVDESVPDDAQDSLSLEDELAALLGVGRTRSALESNTEAGGEASVYAATAPEEEPAVEGDYVLEADQPYESGAWVEQAEAEHEPVAHTPDVDTELVAHGGDMEQVEDDFDFEFEFHPEDGIEATDAVAYEMEDDRSAAQPADSFQEDGVSVEDDVAFDHGDFEAALADEFADLTQDEAVQPAAAEFEAEKEPEADPFATLATMGLGTSQAAGWQPAAQRVMPSRNEPDAPEIETIEVPEARVALADDLDIPDIAFDDQPARAVAFDDLEAELSQAFGEPAPVESTPPAAPAHADMDEFDVDFARMFETETWDEYSGHANAAAAAAAVGAGAGVYAAGRHAAVGQGQGLAGTEYGPNDGYYSDENPDVIDERALGYDPDAEGDLAIPYASETPPASRQRGFAIAAVVAGVAIVGGIGAFAYSWSGGDDAPPALVRAEDGPVKVKPENPGGVVVPNQDNKVYERVAGAPVEPPSQETLISGTEEPLDIQETPTRPLVTEPAADATPQPQGEAIAQAPVETAPEAGASEPLPGVDLAIAEAEPAAQPSGKSEDRIDPATAAAEPTGNEQIAAVTPRKVRTMIVRPDGTLVPREEPAPAAQPVAAAPAAAPQASAPTVAPTSQAAPAPAAAEVPASSGVQPAAEQGQAATTPAPEVAAAAPALPTSAAVLPSRPADQPVEIVGEVKARTQLAAAEPAAAAAAAATAGWSMQIASQPSPEGAQASYEDLARRYGSVLGGRGVNIVKAEIAGKGTFWRVRVPAGSREEAIQLCNQYKAAGGSCFVSK